MCYTFNEKSDQASEGLLRSGLYVNLQSDEAIEMDLVYLTYRAERDLYDWRQATDPSGLWGSLNWRDYISFLRRTPILLAAARQVMKMVLLTVQPEQFDFSPHEDETLYKIPDLADDETITLAQLFPGAESFPAVQFLMLQAQRGYYPQLKKIRGPLYAWETYITELLMGKDEINDPLIRGFRHTLMKIDFRSQWEYWYPIIQNVVEGEIQ